MSDQKTIRAALETRLNTWALAQTPAVAVAFEGVPFTPPTTARHLRAFLLPNQTANPSMGISHTLRQGIFQVDCVAPDGTGSAVVETLAEAIVALYPRGLSLSGLLIYRTPSIAGPFVVDGYRRVPVSILYEQHIFI